MAFQTFVKSQFGTLPIEQVLASPASVLLGVNDAAATGLATLNVSTVFDLSVSTVFDSAARIVAAADDPRSVMRRFGRAPSTLVDDGGTSTPTTDLPYADIGVLAGVDADSETLQVQLGVRTIRDLAYWPPFLAAKAVLIEAYNPAFGSDVDPEAPAELVPKSGEFGIEQHQYSTVVMFQGRFEGQAKNLSGVLFDITAEPLAGFDHVRYGARLTYSHLWRPVGVAKGHLLHSLPLAPGETTNVAVIDWTNKSSAATQQSLSESERLNSSNDRARTVSQIADSVANEFTSGSSVTSTESTSLEGSIGGLAGLLVGSASGAMNQQVAATHTVSAGTRDIATALKQNINDATQQVSSSLRSQRAASVSEVNQAQSEHLATRSVTNYNHMHALTVQYYELVQVYETETRLANAERCIFLPMKPIDFSDERNIIRYLPILKATALESGTRSLLADLEETHGGLVLSFAAGPGRLPSSALRNDFLLGSVVSTWRPALDLNARNLARDGFITYTGDLDHITVDYQVQLTNVRWSPMRAQTPQTPITAVNILLQNGSTVRIGQSAAADADPAQIAGDLPKGERLSFASIRQLSVEVDQHYSTKDSTTQQPGDFFVRLELGIARDDEAAWLDCSFLNGSDETSLARTIYTVSGTADLTQLGAVLDQNQLYYSQQIWLREDPQARIMQFAPLQLTLGDTVVNLVDHLPPQPLQVVGNYLVYRFTYEEDGEWTTWVAQNVDRSRVADVDTVAVPTGGVFGEAVLGRANSAEKLDLTRFFDWQDSPPPAPPQVQALMAGTHTPAQAPDLPTFDKPLVSIQNPVALPDPVTLSSVLGAVTTNGAFRDMSGASASGDAANQGLDASGAAATASLNAAGAALATTLSALADALSAKPAAQKSMSDAGAAVNKKADEAKKDGEAKDATPKDEGTTAEGTGDGTDTTGDGTGTTGDGTGTTGDGTGTTGDGTETTGGGADTTDTADAGKTATAALVHKALADQGIVTSSSSSSSDGSTSG